MKFGTKLTHRPAINITSLIDVLFLLLIFFLVTSTFLEHPGLKLDLPKASSSSPQKLEKLVIAVKADGTIHLNNKPVSLEDLKTELDKQIILQ